MKIFSLFRGAAMSAMPQILFIGLGSTIKTKDSSSKPGYLVRQIVGKRIFFAIYEARPITKDDAFDLVQQANPDWNAERVKEELYPELKKPISGN